MRHPRLWAAAFVGVWFLAFRVLSFDGFENDYYIIVARAQQVLAGEWPLRDFTDPGMPLSYLLSAATASVFGSTLLTEALLSIAMLTATAVLAFLLASRAGRSVAVGLGATALLALLPVRLYSTTKVLVPMVALLLAWRYADRPTRGRLIGLAAWTAAAFLIRHDYGAYLGVGGLVLIVVQHTGDTGTLRRHALAFAGWAAAFTLPWLAYVQWAQGLPAYVASALRFSAAEARRTAAAWPTFDASPILQIGNLAALAFYGLLALAVATLGLTWLNPKPFPTRAHVTYLAALLIMMTAVFLRDDLLARLPDIVPAAAVLIAWHTPADSSPLACPRWPVSSGLSSSP